VRADREFAGVGIVITCLPERAPLPSQPDPQAVRVRSHSTTSTVLKKKSLVNLKFARDVPLS
jgi:hypothetical protein